MYIVICLYVNNKRLMTYTYIDCLQLYGNSICNHAHWQFQCALLEPVTVVLFHKL